MEEKEQIYNSNYANDSTIGQYNISIGVYKLCPLCNSTFSKDYKKYPIPAEDFQCFCDNCLSDLRDIIKKKE